MALIACSECGKNVSSMAKKCPHCGVEINNINSSDSLQEESFKIPDLKHKLAIAGSSMLTVGVFLPFVKMPIVGSMSYIQGDGAFIFILGIISFFLIFKNLYNKLHITGGLSLLLLLFAYSNFTSSKNSEVGIANLISFEWGFGVLIIGAILLVAIPFINFDAQN